MSNTPNTPKRKPVIIKGNFAERIRSRIRIYPKDFERNYRLADYTINAAFLRHGEQWFDKDILLKLISRKVRRPNHVFLNLNMTREEILTNPKINDAQIKNLSQFLKTHKSIFLKPTNVFAAEGKDISQINLNGNKLTIKTTRNDFDELVFYFKDKKSKIDYKNKTIEIDINGDLENILSRLLYSMKLRKFVAEEEVKMPLYNGQKWELRTISQQHNKDYFTMMAEIKAGKEGSIVANIAQGGNSYDPSKTISQIYAEKYPNLSDEKIIKLTEEFFKEIRKITKTILSIMNTYIQSMAIKHFENFPYERLKISQTAIDFHAIFNPKTGKLEPVVNEIQYPNFGLALQPLERRIYRKNKELTKKRDARLLKLFRND